MEWMILPFKRYAQFSGRSRRKEYWMYILLIVIVSLVLSVLDGMLGLGGRNAAGSTAVAGGFGYGASTRGGVLSNIFSLATIVPSLAVGVRRLHDTDRSGYWILLPLVPILVGVIAMVAGFAGGVSGLLMIVSGVAFLAAFICSILVLIWYCTDGTRGPNQYGDDPKADIPADLRTTFE